MIQQGRLSDDEFNQDFIKRGLGIKKKDEQGFLGRVQRELVCFGEEK